MTTHVPDGTPDQGNGVAGIGAGPVAGPVAAGSALVGTLIRGRGTSPRPLLRKVFSKLGVSSRRELRGALPGLERAAVPA